MKTRTLTVALGLVALAGLARVTWLTDWERPAAAAPAAGPWIGLRLGDGHAGGVRVVGVLRGSPGEKAGVHVDDEVLSVDDHATPSPKELMTRIRDGAVGQRVQLRLVDTRGHTRTVPAVLAEKPDREQLQRATLIGQPAPDFAPSVQVGPKLGRLSSLRGNVVLIDFFATWCGPCVESMPRVETLHQRLKKKGLVVLGVSTEAAATVAGAAARFHVTYPLASDEDEKISGAYEVFGLPTAIVIDRKGIIREVSVGDPDAIEAAVRTAVDAPAK